MVAANAVSTTRRLGWIAGRMGFSGEVHVLRDGYYPKGGGLVEAKISPIRGFKSIVRARRSDVKRIRGVSTCGGLPRHVAERQADAAVKVLREEGFEQKSTSRPLVGHLRPLSPGSVICLWVEGDALIGDDGLGERGKTAERVGSEAAQGLVDQIKPGAYVDQHTADNLILPCSLAIGTSSFTVSRLTMHTLTAVEVAKRITARR